MRAMRIAIAAMATAVMACNAEGSGHQPATSAAPATTTASLPTDAAPPAQADPTTSAKASAPSSSASASEAGDDRSCPRDMEWVHGMYCPRVQHICVDRPRLPGGGFKQCRRFKEPSVCLSKKRTDVSFCMDRFEWPNQKGAKPRTLTSWPEARKMCAASGKRLCTADEFNFACEGESLKPHVYGYTRDDSVCNFDRKYIERTYNYKRREECDAIPGCKAEYDRLDQRVPSGTMKRCVSDHGIFDLNGNANEWVFRTDQRSPKRSGLKGGWWGPVRNRCRPMTTFHLEGDYGYEVGFRCCKDAPPTPTTP